VRSPEGRTPGSKFQGQYVFTVFCEMCVCVCVLVVLVSPLVVSPSLYIKHLVQCFNLMLLGKGRGLCR
jgi:hypothetical protein